MALGDSYATLTEFKNYIKGYTTTDDDDEITDSLEAASREIELHCGRQFNTASVATARFYEARNVWTLMVDDFSTTAGLVISVGDTTLTTANYQLEPLNGIVDGQAGWPFYRIRTRAGYNFPTYYGSDLIEVTALWGWAEVPKAVKQSCIALASENLKVLREAPFGVAGNDQWGVVRVRDNQRITRWLAPYRRLDGVVA